MDNYFGRRAFDSGAAPVTAIIQASCRSTYVQINSWYIPSLGEGGRAE
jgi:hypothetical protein